MFFSKNKIRKTENELLLSHLEKLKNSVKQKELLMVNSVDEHQELSYRASLEKAKYLFLLKEARYRHVGVKKYG